MNNGRFMNTLLYMSVFRRVAETGSFSEVAREMGISQPTVSKHVAALEAHLGVKLLNRSTRQLSLSEAGQQFHDQCTRILDELNEVEASLRQQQSQPSGTLRVNTAVTFGETVIVPRLWKFMDQYPELQLELIMDDHYIDLVKEGVDVAVRVGPLTDSSLIARKLGSFERMVVATPEYLQHHGEPATPQQLKQHQCIVFTLLSTRHEWHFNGPDGKETVKVHGRFAVNNPNAMRQAILAHQGIGVTPTWLIDNDLQQGRLKSILTDYTPTAMEIHALYPQRRYVPAKVRSFIDFLHAELNSG